MTDQPTTQERCTCKAAMQGTSRHLTDCPLSTTQEAEKALEKIQTTLDFLNGRSVVVGSMNGTIDVSQALAALRSLRTQHAEMQRHQPGTADVARVIAAHSSLTKDQTQVEGAGHRVYSQGEGEGCYFCLLLLTIESLEAQSAKDREEIERLKADRDETQEDYGREHGMLLNAQAQHTKDQERIEELEKVARDVLAVAPMGHHLAATDDDWHRRLRALSQVLNTPDTQGGEA